MLHGLRPKKSLGQNFLINTGILEKIVSAAELSSDDTVLEVGPGTGNLTKLLSEKAGRVIAVEKDRRVIEELKEKFKNTNVEIIEGDVLKLTRLNLVIQGLTLYKIVGNIPYYITSHLLKTIFEEWPRPELIVLTVQKEVAKRIVAKPPDMNLLALSVQFYSDPKIVGYVSKGSFRPMPKVDSAIIKLTTYSQPLTAAPEKLIKIAQKAFAGKRKQIKNTIGLDLLEKAGIKISLRPEELSISDWLRLVDNI